MAKKYTKQYVLGIIKDIEDIYTTAKANVEKQKTDVEAAITALNIQKGAFMALDDNFEIPPENLELVKKLEEARDMVTTATKVVDGTKLKTK